MARIPGKRIGLNAERAMQCVTQHVPAVCWRGTHPWSGAGCLCVCRYVTEPVVISRLVRNRVLVRQVALGAQHCLALTPVGVMSWGVADGGRLGHGDDKDRWDPTRIEAFDDMIVTQVSAGAWHSAAIVQIPPHATGGWVRVLHDAGSLGALQLGWGFVPLTCGCVWWQVYTWGAGYCGQLGQRGTSVSPLPAVVPGFVERNVTVTYVTCGAYHNACLTSDGDCMTWGSNAGNCLGRPAAMALKEQCT